MKSIFGVFFAVVALVFASPVSADDFNIEQFIGKPTTGGATCVSLMDARVFVARSFAFDGQGLSLMFREGKCSMSEHYVPKRIVEYFAWDLIILEVMGGEDFIMTKWVVATPAALIPLVKAEELHEVEPPGKIAPPSEVAPPQEILPPRAPAAWE